MWPIDSIIERPADGYFLRDLLIFNGLRSGGYAAKGFIFEPPDLNNSQGAELNHFQDQITILLASLIDNKRRQVQWLCDSNYRIELLHFNEETQRVGDIW